MSEEKFVEAKEWLNEHFFLIRCEDDELPSIDWLLGLARAAVLRHGIRGLVIDPYNELDHQRPSQQSVCLPLVHLLNYFTFSCHVSKTFA